jgi:hypothetical protein
MALYHGYIGVGIGHSLATGVGESYRLEGNFSFFSFSRDTLWIHKLFAYGFLFFYGVTLREKIIEPFTTSDKD